MVHFLAGKRGLVYLRVKIPSWQKDITHKLAKSSYILATEKSSKTIYVPEPYISGREIMLYA